MWKKMSYQMHPLIPKITLSSNCAMFFNKAFVLQFKIKTKKCVEVFFNEQALQIGLKFHSVPVEDATRIRSAKGAYSISVTSFIKTYDIDYTEYAFENARRDSDSKMIIADLVSKHKGVE